MCSAAILPCPTAALPSRLNFLWLCHLQEGKLRAKQQQELDALIQKGARGRDELEIASVQDMERRVQRYRNLVAELSNLHKLEVQRPASESTRARTDLHDLLKASTFR